jgi:polysaccharide biosynthesis transport protein
MSGNQMQPVGPHDADLSFQDGFVPQDNGGSSPPPPSGGIKLGRYLAALNRFKWLIALCLMLGAAGGYVATKFIEPEFEVQSTIMLESGSGTQSTQDRGPIKAEELLEQSGWQDLLRSFTIADPVVNELALFVEPDAARDSALFRSFRVDQSRGLLPGDFVLKITGKKYELSFSAGVPIETGMVGDSIGRKQGFMWQPSAEEFTGREEIGFRVRTPRETSLALIRKLQMELKDGSPFLFLRLTGKDANRTAATLNEWTSQFVAVATQLKKENVMKYATILEGQREFAAEDLNKAEDALERFRVQTVTKPNERPSITPGLEMTNSPVYERYFNDKIAAEALQRDLARLEAIAAAGRQSGNIAREAVLSVELVSKDPAAADLVAALEEQSAKEAAIRALRQRYTDEYQGVKDASDALTTVRAITVPNLLNKYLETIRIRERQLTSTIDVASRELRSLPARTIEEQRLKRSVEVADAMYRDLNLKSAQAKLAEAATIPDVRVMDIAVPPVSPTRNTKPVIILAAIAASLGLGIFLAILIDQMDKRFRYPEQATDDLGLFILGVVPSIATGRRRHASDQAAQVVESFRTIRMNVRYAADPGRPLAMTITSPGPNDGKSLISSNLALSFAEAGARTLLIDGDIRRGELGKTFGVVSKPGLVEYLDGTALIAEVLYPATSHQNLTVMPSGARRRRAPELLATPRLNQLIAQMSSEYDVVIVDSPPLGAGFDAYALATATGNMALVLRSGVTDRKMAAAKLEIVDTLPVRVMGAILNGIKLSGVYQYYSYYQDYAAQDEPMARLESGSKKNVPVPVSDRA